MHRTHLPLLLALAALFMAGCSTMETLPLLPASPAGPPGHESAGGRDEHISRRMESSLLTQAELSRVIASLMRRCSRIVIVRLHLREVLIGYREDESEPTRVASLSRVGGEQGQMVLVVGMETAKTGTHITNVMTLSPLGELRGLDAYEQKKEEFLAQFSGRKANSDLGDIDAVTGATSISTTLRNLIGAEAKTILAWTRNPSQLSELAAKGWPLSPFAEDTSWKPAHDDQPERNAGAASQRGGAMGSMGWPVTQQVGDHAQTRERTGTVPAVYVKLFLLGLAVVLVAIGQFCRGHHDKRPLIRMVSLSLRICP